MTDGSSDTAGDLELLLETMVAERGIRTRDAALTLLTEKVADLLGVELVVVRLLDADRRSLRAVAIYGTAALADEHAQLLRQERLYIDDLSSSVVRRGMLPPSLEAFRSGRLEVVASADRSGPFEPAAMCAAPLVRRGRAEGVLALYWREPHDPDRQERARIRTAARFTALVVEITGHADAARDVIADVRGEADRAAQRAASADELARFQRRAVELLPVLARTPDALAALLRDEHVASAEFSPRLSAGARALLVEGEAHPYGTVRWRGEVDAVRSEMIAFAAGLLATAFDLRERERVLASARPRALTVIADEHSAASAVADAEGILGLDRGGDHQLVVGGFRTADDAYLGAQALELGGVRRRTAATVIALGTRIVALCDDARSAHTLAEQLRGLEGYRGSGVSARVTPGTSARRLENASTAARVSEAHGGATIAYHDLGPLQELTASVPDQVARDLVRRSIGPLDEYDAKHGTQLVETLSTFLALNGSTMRTAERMHLHVNTVKQRIDRIGRLVGADVRDFTQVGRLLLALEWRALLRDGP